MLQTAILRGEQFGKKREKNRVAATCICLACMKCVARQKFTQILQTLRSVHRQPSGLFSLRIQSIFEKGCQQELLGESLAAFGRLRLCSAFTFHRPVESDCSRPG